MGFALSCPAQITHPPLRIISGSGAWSADFYNAIYMVERPLNGMHFALFIFTTFFTTSTTC